jgi:hypothetical protein
MIELLERSYSEKSTNLTIKYLIVLEKYYKDYTDNNFVEYNEP